jgi:hypothetical protein
MQSTDPMTQLIAANALATFVYNNARVKLHIGTQYKFTFDFFQKFLQHTNEHVRCKASFQVNACFQLMIACQST